MSAKLSIERVSKRFGSERPAVDDVSLKIGRNEFFALLGPSGCGKTTLLRMIAGLETPTSGRIAIDGEDLTEVPANRRPVNLVFQNYAIFPHMSVVENVEYGLMVAGESKAGRRKKALEALDLVQLASYANRAPSQLSGGQRQRVALARALVKRPKVLLLDEPLSALDAKLREAMQLELVHLQRQLGFTFVIVTHDQDEALSIATRVAVMHEGRVMQVGAPRDLYERPASRFVADFIGRINLFPAEAIEAAADRVTCRSPELGTVHVPGQGPGSGPVTLAVRPERIRIGPAGSGTAVALEGAVEDVAYFGDISRLVVSAAGHRIQASLPNTDSIAGALRPGDRISLHWNPDDMLLLAE